MEYTLYVNPHIAIPVYLLLEYVMLPALNVILKDQYYY